MRARLLVFTLLAGVLLACGGQGQPTTQDEASRHSSSSPTPPSETSSPANSVELPGSPTIQEIRERGKLMVGLRSNHPAFAVREGPGEYGGFDVEIAKIIAEGIGLDPKTDIAYRWLPPSLLSDALVAGNVDVQIGGFDPKTPKTSNVGPYIVTGSSPHFIGIRPGDDAMRGELQGILDASVDNGAWQRAYDTTLGKAGIEGDPR